MVSCRIEGIEVDTEQRNQIGTGRVKESTRPRQRQRDRNSTLVVARGEDDGAGLIPDEALGDAWRAGGGGGRGGWACAAGDGGGADDLDGEGVAVGAGPELVDLGEDGLPERRLVAALGRRRGGHGRWW